MPETLIYLERFTDEVMPCRPTLEEWAAWLAEPDPAWGRDAPAKDGEEFDAYSLLVLGDVRIDLVDGEWQAVEPVPEGTDSYFLRHHEGSGGWNAEFSANTIQDTMDCFDEPGPQWLACVRDGDGLKVRFEAAGPRCVVIDKAN